MANREMPDGYPHQSRDKGKPAEGKPPEGIQKGKQEMIGITDKTKPLKTLFSAALSSDFIQLFS
jgi:hypothetical protein